MPLANQIAPIHTPGLKFWHVPILLARACAATWYQPITIVGTIFIQSKSWAQNEGKKWAQKSALSLTRANHFVPTVTGYWVQVGTKFSALNSADQSNVLTRVLCSNASPLYFLYPNASPLSIFGELRAWFQSDKTHIMCDHNMYCNIVYY